MKTPAILPPIDLDQDACYRAVITRDPRWDGRIFGCVTSTGIYCRPVCPARTPKRENMFFYPTAAACEEAGFRACLRCRPETAPDMGAWRGSSNTVSRALALIEQGALDEDDVDALAARLGVGERQLRRLFRQHLGASPVGVAQTRRVLLAKQLIHETDLPMAQVAMASGFGSVRRFNETFQALYDRPPLALRRRSSARAAEQGAVTLMLRYRPPYDWKGMIGFLAARAIPGVEVVTADRYARTIDIDGAMGTVAVSPAGGDRLAVEVRFPKMTALPTILARVKRVFDLSADPATIEDHLRRDPDLARMIAARPGLRAPGAWDGLELGVRAILGQQITVPAAVKLAGRLTAEYGEALPDDWAREGLTHAFPAAGRLAAADIAGHGLMPGARARAISGLAAAVAADPHLFGPKASLEEAVAALRALPGIGEWTAQYIAMRQMREPDAFPAADVGLMRALTDEAGVRPTPAELLARAEAWRPWRAYAALHLWASDPAAPKPAGEKADARRAA
jgi:AraC family transcriptional regulator of adaptative response / DNA-3-methyladenine glycosylase II